MFSKRVVGGGGGDLKLSDYEKTQTLQRFCLEIAAAVTFKNPGRSGQRGGAGEAQQTRAIRFISKFVFRRNSTNLFIREKHSN